MNSVIIVLLNLFVYFEKTKLSVVRRGMKSHAALLTEPLRCDFPLQGFAGEWNVYGVSYRIESYRGK